VLGTQEKKKPAVLNNFYNFWGGGKTRRKEEKSHFQGPGAQALIEKITREGKTQPGDLPEKAAAA